MSKVVNLAQVIVVFLVATASVAGQTADSKQARKHPFTVTDLLATRGQIDISVGKNGSVALGATTFSVGGDREIWLIPDGGSPKQIASRDPLRQGDFYGISPLGRYVAFATSRGATDHGMLLEVDDLVTGASVRPLSGEWLRFMWSCVWVDEERMACLTLPPALSRAEGASQRAAIEGWRRQAEEDRTTASVLDSGPGTPPKLGGEARLHVVDVRHSTEKTVATVETFDFALLKPLTPSPGGHWVAMLTQTRNPPKEPIETLYGVAGGFKSMQGTLTIAPANGETSAKQVQGAFFQTSGKTPYYRTSVFQWSPDGASLAILGKAKDENEVVTTVYTVDPATGVARPQTPANWQAADLGWTSGSHLVVYGCKDDPAYKVPAVLYEHVNLPGCIDKGRRDWWTVTPAGLGVNLTKALPTTPEKIIPGAPGRDEIVGVSGGALWRIPADGGAPTNLTSAQGVVVSKVVWPADNATSREGLVLEGKKNGDAGWLQVTFDPDGTVHQSWIANSTKEGIFKGYSAKTGIVVQSDEDTGTFVWEAQADQQKQVLALNKHMASIEWPRAIKVGYRGMDGNELQATVMLPPGYLEGRKYPLVLWVYPGANLCAAHGGNHHPGFDNALVLAGRGYVVACPEMPIPPRGVAANWRAELPKGIFGAIDKLVEMGIADPNRVLAYGHSFGGFTTLSLVSMTNRFNAVVAAAPVSDFLSMYGSFGATQHFEGAHERMNWPVLAELSQTSMGVPPWENMEEYIQNSPIIYMNRVNTPVLLFHGDVDNLPIQQSEEFFTGMYRLGKRAQFVRYWGETHSILAPANIRDYWSRVSAWFDEFTDVSRDERGNLLWDGDKVKSRNGAPPLKPEDFLRLDEAISKSKN